ncbi:MAG: MFS transporter [Propionibacteriaceae bacterium]|jgi:MFS family permease|nr:MFS transporter [Propionibacteriaceae bacterium]
MRSYLDILRLPGALKFCAAALLARCGGAMMGLGQLLMVRLVYGPGCYGWAGAVAAANALAWAVGTAFLAPLVDRHGQRRVMYPAYLVSVAFLAWLIVLAVARAPVWTLLPVTVVSGLCSGSPGALVRARWHHVTANARQLHTAYSLESTLDELTFVVGPVAATVLATQVHPAAGLVAPIILGLAGAHFFYGQRATEPPLAPRPPARSREDRRPWSERLILFLPGVAPVVATNVLIGGFFGAVDVSVVATTDAWGALGASGPVLAVFSVGSAVAGFVYGARAWRSPLVNRFAVLVTAALVTSCGLLVADGVWALALAGLLMGGTVAPSLINGNALLTRLVPQGRLTEGLAWMATSLGVGVSIGSSTAGRAIDWMGHVGGLRVAVACAGLAALIAWAVRRPLGRALAARAGGGDD